MRTCLSAALELQASSLPPRWLHNSRLLHLEGYALYKPDLTKAAIAEARAAGAQVGMQDRLQTLCHDVSGRPARQSWLLQIASRCLSCAL